MLMLSGAAWPLGLVSVVGDCALLGQTTERHSLLKHLLYHRNDPRPLSRSLVPEGRWLRSGAWHLILETHYPLLRSSSVLPAGVTVNDLTQPHSSITSLPSHDSPLVLLPTCNAIKLWRSSQFARFLA